MKVSFAPLHPTFTFQHHDQIQPLFQSADTTSNYQHVVGARYLPHPPLTRPLPRHYSANPPRENKNAPPPPQAYHSLHGPTNPSRSAHPKTVPPHILQETEARSPIRTPKALSLPLRHPEIATVICHLQTTAQHVDRLYPRNPLGRRTNATDYPSWRGEAL